MATKVWFEQGCVFTPIPIVAEGFRRVVKLAKQLECNVNVTSGREGDHMVDSLHYLDRAWDMQTNKFILFKLKEVLGKGWDVVEYPWGFHCEYDPK